MNGEGNKKNIRIGKLLLTKTECFSFLSVLVSFCIFVGTTAAWYSKNKETSSDGIALKVSVTPNLIISTSKVAIQKQNFIDSEASPFFASFAPKSKSLAPSTHTSPAISSTGLVYVSNTTQIAPKTGLPYNGGVLTYQEVPSSSSSGYYKDFTVYVASAGKQMDNKKLSATLKATLTGGAVISNTRAENAVSIDFWVDNQYTTTASIKNKGPVTITSGSIYQNTSKYITVKMRLYIDGALEYALGQTYVRSANISAKDIILEVALSAD